MKQIGRQVLFLNTGKKNPRNGEGSFIRLRDGSIMYAYTQYYGDEGGDHSTARIAACSSCDEGESWQDCGVIIEKEDYAMNIMSASLLRMNNGDLGIFYLRKEKKYGDLICMPMLRRSSDEGTTFSEPVSCISVKGYYVLNNDRVIKLKNGRIIFAVAYHGISGEASKPGVVRVIYSDDDGITWNMFPNSVRAPFEDITQLQEPGVYEFNDGNLWMWYRTAYGYQYQSFSTDHGENWTNPVPNFRFTSPDSPMQVRRTGKYTLAVFNPIAYNCLCKDTEAWKSQKRTPLICTVSKNDARDLTEKDLTFANGNLSNFADKCYYFESDYSDSYCYPAIIEVKDGFLAAYYHSNGTEYCLNCTKILKVLYSEIEDPI